MKRSRPDDERTPQSPDAILDGIYERGYTLRARRRVVQAFTAAVAMSLAVIATVVTFDQEPRGLEILQPPASESPSPDATHGPTETPTDEPSASPTPTPSPTGACRNSYDERCGELVWVPDPGPNAALTLKIYITPANPQVGEQVTIRAVATDPDAPIAPGDVRIYIKEPLITHSDCFHVGAPYGRWDTPPRQAGSAEVTRRYTFESAGSFPIFVVAWSYGDSFTGEGCYAHSPYRSYRLGEKTIEVAGPASPSPSASQSPEPSPTET